MIWIAIVLAGGFGALARYEMIGLVQRRVRDPRPWGTFVVNVSGAALLGFVVGSAPGTWWALPVTAGFLGGYTTFSTWMVETIYLAESGGSAGIRSGIWNLAGTLVIGAGVAGIGLLVGTMM